MVTGQESLGEGQHMRRKEQQAGGVMGGGREREKRGVLWLGDVCLECEKGAGQGG